MAGDVIMLPSGARDFANPQLERSSGRGSGHSRIPHEKGEIDEGEGRDEAPDRRKTRVEP